MTRDEEDLLVEQVAGAFRPRAGDATVGYHKAWHDLGAEGRIRAYELARVQRPLEAALDGEGLSSTARAVLSRILSARES